MKSSLKNIVYHHNPLLVLSYLSRYTAQENMSSHIAHDLNISVGSAHTILRQFEKSGLIMSRNIGKSVIYSIDQTNPLIHAFRIFENLLELQEIVGQIKQFSRKIILFGSCARGRDNNTSDIDLFVVADENNHDLIQNTLNDAVMERRINLVLINLFEYIDMEKSDPVFYNEIMKGIELWEVSDQGV